MSKIKTTIVNAVYNEAIKRTREWGVDLEDCYYPSHNYASQIHNKIIAGIAGRIAGMFHGHRFYLHVNNHRIIIQVGNLEAHSFYYHNPNFWKEAENYAKNQAENYAKNQAMNVNVVSYIR